MAQASRRCGTCGDLIYRVAPVAPIPAYCERPDCYRRCCIDGCDDKASCKRMCQFHYARARKYGDPLVGPRKQAKPYRGRICEAAGCESTAVANGFCNPHNRRNARYGDPLSGAEPRRREHSECSVDGCSRTAWCKGLCQLHDQRSRRLGDPGEAQPRIKYYEPGATCRVANCEAEVFVHSLCARHGYAERRYGDPLATRFPWAEPSPCKVCGDPPGGRFRQFCSTACFGAWKSYGADVRVGINCVRCDTYIPFLTVDAQGHKRYRMRSYCTKCRGRYTAWGMHVSDLVLRDGPTCRLCGVDIDLALKRNAPGGTLCASVDHIVPRSMGGTDDPSNLQLAHLLCNIRKGGRPRMRSQVE